MTARDWFGLVVRTVGLLLTLVGTGFLVMVLGGFFSPMVNNPGALIAPLINCLGVIVVGVFLLRGAPGLIDFSYPAHP